jgi:hypothetical protein
MREEEGYEARFDLVQQMLRKWQEEGPPGNPGDDRLTGSDQADALSGGAGNDILDAKAAIHNNMNKL